MGDDKIKLYAILLFLALPVFVGSLLVSSYFTL